VNVGSQQEQEDLLELAPVLKEEINVKEIEIVSEVGELVNYKLLPNNRELGPRLGKMFPAVDKALRNIDPAEAARTLQSGQPIVVEAAGQEFELGPDDVLVQTESRGGLAVASDKGITVAVDTKLTPQLIREGYARDLVRALNNMRKEAGFDISDRIIVAYEADGEAATAVRDFSDYIKQETLSIQIEPGKMDHASYEGWIDVGGQDILLAISRAE
jgi:isoleucyl-tRNA synthetase